MKMVHVVKPGEISSGTIGLGAKNMVFWEWFGRLDIHTKWGMLYHRKVSRHSTTKGCSIWIGRTITKRLRPGQRLSFTTISDAAVMMEVA